MPNSFNIKPIYVFRRLVQYHQAYSLPSTTLKSIIIANYYTSFEENYTFICSCYINTSRKFPPSHFPFHKASILHFPNFHCTTPITKINKKYLITEQQKFLTNHNPRKRKPYYNLKRTYMDQLRLGQKQVWSIKYSCFI